MSPKPYVQLEPSSIVDSDAICFPWQDTTANAGITFKGAFEALVTNWAFWEQDFSS